MTRPALLFYCQHSVGLGHLMRSYALCARLAERFRVVLVCGGALPDGIAPPRNVELVALAPLGVGASGRFESHRADLPVERAWTARRERILATVHRVRPAAVLVELFPFGRAKFARELVPLLETARTLGAVTACSLRDILVSRRPNQRSHDERACTLANAHLDAVLVHCDPAFARLEETFGAHAELRVPVEYTGFVTAPPPVRAQRGDRIVVSAGGGLVGGPLLRTAAAAQQLTGLPMRLIAGPFCPPEDWHALKQAAHHGLEVVRTVPDLATELTYAAASVSQCGYNTALEVIRAGVPALVVPYATAEEDEQRRRARGLAQLGAVRVLDPARLDPRTLAAELERLPAFEPATPRLDLDGARRATELLWERVAVIEARSA